MSNLDDNLDAFCDALSDEDREALELDAAYRYGHTGAVAAIYTKRIKRLQDRAERAERERDEAQYHAGKLLDELNATRDMLKRESRQHAETAAKLDEWRDRCGEALVRLDKWAKAERCTGEEPLPPPCRGIRITHWAEVPEGEE